MENYCKLIFISTARNLTVINLIAGMKTTIVISFFLFLSVLSTLSALHLCLGGDRVKSLNMKLSELSATTPVSLQ